MTYRFSEEETLCEMCGCNKHWVRLVDNDTGDIIEGDKDSEVICFYCPACMKMEIR